MKKNIFALLLAILMFISVIPTETIQAQEDVVPDVNLKLVINRELGREDAHPISIADMQRLTSLTHISSQIYGFGPSYRIKRLDGMQYAKNLKYLKLHHNAIEDLTPLKGLLNLQEIDFEEAIKHNDTQTLVKDFTVLSTLTGLTKIKWKWQPGAGDNIIKGISTLPNLKNLTIDRCNVTDLTHLSSLTTLEVLDLSENNLTSLKGLESLTNLKELILFKNVNLGNHLIPISNLRSLEKLNLSMCEIEGDISAIKELTNLTSLDISINKIYDISVLQNLVKLNYLSGSRQWIEVVSSNKSIDNPLRDKNGKVILITETSELKNEGAKIILLDDPESFYKSYDTGFISEDWEFSGNFRFTYDKPANVIGPIDPTNPDGTNPNKPDTHVTVTFEQGNHGTIAGKRVYYVNPSAGIKLSELKKPEITAEDGYTHIVWDKDDEIVINADLIVTAKYGKTILPYEPTNPEKPLDPTDPDGTNPDKPKDYVTVSFLKGTHVTLSIPGKMGLEKVEYYVNPKAGKIMADIAEPTINPIFGYKVANVKWSPALDGTRLITNDLNYTAQYDITPTPTPTPNPRPWWPIEPYIPDNRPKPRPITPNDDTVIIPGNEMTDRDTDIHYLYILGLPDGTFGPFKNISRAEVAMMFARIISGQQRFYQTNTIYPDVDSNHWASGAISYLTDKGIFKGRPDGSFGPHENMTRGEYATIIARMQNIEGGLKLFPDISGHWAEAYIRVCADKEYIMGYPDGTFKPNHSITRSEAVAMTNRMLNRKGDVSFITSHIDLTMAFPDIAEDFWAYGHIYDASLTHEFIRNVDQSETWIRILEAGRKIR